jgi:hypothetical protein
MKSKEWLFEAEQNVAKKKLDQQLNMLSNQEIDYLLSVLLSNNLQEEQINRTPEEIEDMIRRGFDPVTGNKITSPAAQAAISNQPKATTTKQTSIRKKSQEEVQVKKTIAQLPKKEKEALKKVLQQEKVKREKKGKKVDAPKKPAGMLSKIVVGLAIAIGALAAIPDSPKDAEQQTTAQQDEQPDDNKMLMKAGENAPWRIKRYVAQSAFDEDSLKFRNWKMHFIFENPDDKNASTWLMVSGEVNGKNRLGAYVGFKKFIAAIDPYTGEVDSGKYYTEDNEKYYQVLALMKSYKTLDAPIIGPSD